MADEKKKKNEDREEQAAQVASSADRGTQQQGPSEQAPAEGAKAQVNPEINAATVSFPTGEDDDGVMQSETYEAGKVYDVDPELLKVKDVLGRPLLVEVNE